MMELPLLVCCTCIPFLELVSWICALGDFLVLQNVFFYVLNKISIDFNTLEGSSFKGWVVIR
jgi:hypothetical protein